MPPSHVKTIRELIYWEYAKLIAEAAVGSRKNYGFVTHSYKRLKSGKMNPPVREQDAGERRQRLCLL